MYLFIYSKPFFIVFNVREMKMLKYQCVVTVFPLSLLLVIRIRALVLFSFSLFFSALNLHSWNCFITPVIAHFEKCILIYNSNFLFCFSLFFPVLILYYLHIVHFVFLISFRFVCVRTK